MNRYQRWQRFVDIAGAVASILLTLLIVGVMIYVIEALELTDWTLWYSRVTIHWKSVISSVLVYGVVFLLLITWPKENKYG